ncbi:MAG: nucleotide exchange factor GrpE [Candidatus Hydrogenedentes bacterium]|nr:nucleotide exchange factor GrpE [Candidatus Hydrogenedentota bacterium]
MNNKTEKTELEKKLESKLAEEKSASSEEVTEPATVNDTNATVTEEPADEAAIVLQKLEKQSAECEQLKDQLLRGRADFDNYRKRMLREMAQIRQTASAKLIQALLPALDNLERALAHTSAEDGFIEGVSMVYKQFQETFSSEGLEPVPALNEIFDPNIHDALATMPSEDIENGRILEEYERGYRLHDTVLRPARVIVSSGPLEVDKTENEIETESEETAPTE